MMIGRINAQTADVRGPDPRRSVELPILAGPPDRTSHAQKRNQGTAASQPSGNGHSSGAADQLRERTPPGASLAPVGRSYVRNVRGFAKRTSHGSPAMEPLAANC